MIITLSARYFAGAEVWIAVEKGQPERSVAKRIPPHERRHAGAPTRDRTNLRLHRERHLHNEDSGFCVLRVKTKGQREETTVVGSLPSVTAGEWLVAEGCWVRDREHGPQFKASTMNTVRPTTAEGIERYLGSGLVMGIARFWLRNWS
jgi:exodeoxyribonuclease V alpha subunit